MVITIVSPFLPKGKRGTHFFEKFWRDPMKAAGIVAEYNPFHTGHRYQIDRTRAALGEETAVVAVMSGNFIQQADCAMADKWTRARLALMGGVDLVLELPTVWAVSSAESFARGAVELLAATGVVEALSFGSECGDTDALSQVAACLDSPVYHAGLRRFLDEGMTFAACRQAVVKGMLGEPLSALLEKPNNNLGVEYIRALNALHSGICPLTVRRTGQGHHETVAFSCREGAEEDLRRAFWEQNPVLSATSIRGHLMEGKWALMEPYLPRGGAGVLREGMTSLEGVRRLEGALMAKLRTMTAADWAALPDSGAAEGLPDRLVRAGRACDSVESFFDLAKTRRYTHARLRRLALWALLGLTTEDRPEHPPYLRVLGFNSRGREVLREMKGRAALPVLTKPAAARDLPEAGRRLFELEARCTDLYGLCLPKVPAGGLEWRCSPAVVE